jgi:hypothetical protein
MRAATRRDAGAMSRLAQAVRAGMADGDSFGDFLDRCADPFATTAPNEVSFEAMMTIISARVAAGKGKARS